MERLFYFDIGIGKIATICFSIVYHQLSYELRVELRFKITRCETESNGSGRKTKLFSRELD